jgi:hypothetical protein
MKYRAAISILLASAIALASMPGFAGPGQGQGGGGNADRAQQMDRDRDFDRDRMQDHDRLEEPDQDRARDSGRMRIHDPATMKDQDIYGSELMTEAERNRYREQLGKSDEQGLGQEFQIQHEMTMQKRALHQGVDLVPPGQGPVYGGELMSVQERNEYREQLRLAKSETDRAQLQTRHQEQMRERARALNIEIEAAE